MLDFLRSSSSSRAGPLGEIQPASWPSSLGLVSTTARSLLHLRKQVMERCQGKSSDAAQGMQDPRMERLPCMHGGTYADDCICERVRQHRCYIVATCDRDLRRRLRKV